MSSEQDSCCFPVGDRPHLVDKHLRRRHGDSWEHLRNVESRRCFQTGGDLQRQDYRREQPRFPFSHRVYMAIDWRESLEPVRWNLGSQVKVVRQVKHNGVGGMTQTEEVPSWVLLEPQS